MLREFQGSFTRRNRRSPRPSRAKLGKPVAEALVTEVLVVLDAARFLIDNAWALLRDEPVPHGNLATKLKSGWLVREPHGVDRNHLAMELSVLHSRYRDSGGAGGGQCGGAEAFGIDAACSAGTGVVAACGGRSRGCVSGRRGRRPGGGGAAPFADRQAGIHRQRSDRQAHRRRGSGTSYSRWCWNWAAKIPCWCSTTPMSMSLRARRFGERL